MSDHLAVTAFRALGALFLELPPSWTRSRIVDLHRLRRAEVTALFEVKRGLAELVLAYAIVLQLAPTSIGRLRL
jgi:hypothetical protein